MVKLYTTLGSPPCRAVLMLARELGIKFEEVEVNLAELEHLTPEFLKINPQHTIPTIIDNNYILWDSHAIMVYLIAKYAKNDRLYPTDVYKRSLVDQRLHFEGGILFPRIKGIFGPFVYTDASTINPKEIESTTEAFKFVDAFLEGRKYVAGDSLTIADLSIVSSVSSLEMEDIIPITPEEYPNLSAWYERMKKLPYYKEINQAGVDILVHMVKSRLK